MIPVERHQQILALVSERGAVSIAELTERLGVSHMTIRRDLQKLEEQGSVLPVSGGVQSADVERAKSVARRMRTGQVDINGGGFNATAPFGGYGQSGNGRERGEWGIDGYLETKSIQL